MNIPSFTISKTTFSKIASGAVVVFACTGVLRAQDANKPATPPANDASVGGAARAESPTISDSEIRDIVKRIARHQIQPLKEGEYKSVAALDEAKATTAPEGITWSYPWGVTLYGMLRSTDATGDKDAEKFVLEHNRIIAKEFAYLWSLKDKATNNANWNAFRNDRNRVKIRGLLSLGHLDSCGAMGVQYIESMMRHPDQVTPEHKEVVARIADWITKKQERLPDGTLWRPRSLNGTVWPDDLYMACPFIVRWAKFTGEKKHLDDAANQIIRQAEMEQDADGLFWHGYFVTEKKPAPFKWGRGNGWVTVATVEVLSALPDEHPSRPKLIEILRKQIDGIKPLQTPNGMWRQVLDKPELWEETSCTAMFAYGIARAVNRGWIDPSNMAIARKAFAGISKNVTAEGVVNETCQGTNIGQELDYYIKRGRPSDDMHGRGPVLLAGVEILMAKPK